MSLAETLSEQFYRWELRGRGWQVWPYPVALEPPFRPFLWHAPAAAQPVLDDARKPTFFGALVERWSGRSQQFTVTDVPDADEEPEPEVAESDRKLVAFTVSLPVDHLVNREAAERFLIALPVTRAPVSFEVIGRSDVITIQLACAERDKATLRQHLEAYFPEAVVSDANEPFRDLPDSETVVVDFGLSHEFMRPLAPPKTFAIDLLIGITAALGDLRDHELGLLQVLFQPTRHPWAESVLRAVSDGEGGSFFADAPEMLPLARQKVAAPLFAAVVRVAARSPYSDRALEIAQGIAAGLAQLANPASNELIPLTNDDYDDTEHWEDVCERTTHRSGMLLSSEELVSLVHLPSASVRSEKLARNAQKTKAPPAIVTGHALVLGENVHRGTTIPVTLAPALRTRHMHVIGASGTGKSTLLLSMIMQDLAHGEGLAVLDPHGDLIDEVLGRIPESRVADVILFDPADEQFPVGFNILQAHSELEKNLLSSDLVATFRRFATSWGDQMTAVLGNAILALLESEQGGTLLDLRRFLADASFRRSFLATVRDPEVVHYFEREFPHLRGQPQASILTRLDAFLRSKLVRYIVAQKEDRLDLGATMHQGKIVLAKLAQGAIGEENAYLLGTLLVAKFHQLALSRQEIAAEERRPFYLYVDEFQHFVTPSLAALLSGARKYRLGLILAHQELRQLLERDSAVASAVLTNPATRVCFRLGDADAQKLREGFASFDAKDLQSLGVGDAICRIERADYDFTLRTQPLEAVDEPAATMRREQVIAHSRATYARPRADVEAELGIAPPVASPAPAAELERVTREVAEPEPRREREAAPPVPVQAATEPRKARPAPASPTLGRGGAEHKYLQHLVKRLAEDRGWRATIEQPVLGGVGSIDVALEKDGKKLACEISVTSSGEHELGNIQKCLAAGYDEVVVLASERRVLAKLEGLVSTSLGADVCAHIRFLQADQFVAHLDELDAEAASREATVRGYKVKVSYRQLGAAEEQARRQAISQVLVQGMRRTRKHE